MKDFYEKYTKISLKYDLTNYIAKSALFIHKTNYIKLNAIKLICDSKKTANRLISSYQIKY